MANASQRYTHLSELRNKRDNSDAASMLTVDEITAEVESRRASVLLSTEAALEGAIRKRNSVSFPHSGAEEPQDQQVPQEDVMMDEVQSDDEEELEEEEEESEEVDDGDGELELVSVEEEEEEAPSKAITSTGGKNFTSYQLYLSNCSFLSPCHQVDQGCTHWKRLLWQRLSRHGCPARVIDGCEAS